MISALLASIWGYLSSNLIFFACYIGNTNSFPEALTLQEETRLLESMEKGDDSARNTLIEHNLRLVAHIVKKYSSGAGDTDDLLSIGTIGLIKGINAYSLSKKTKLSTFLAKCIQNEILMYFRSGKKLNCEISLNEVLSGDSEGNELTIEDIISDEEESVINEVSKNLQIKLLYDKISDVLTSREKYIIINRYGLYGNRERTQNEVADKLGISRSYVSRIEKKAITKLKNSFNGVDF